MQMQMKRKCWILATRLPGSCNANEKKAGLAILISDKIYFKTNSIMKDKQGNYLLLKGSIQEENITFINIYASNTAELKYIKQILIDIKWEIKRNTIIVVDFNNPTYINE